MTFKTRVTFHQYLKLVYSLTYDKWYVAGITIWGVFLFVEIILNVFNFLHSENLITDCIICAVILIGLPYYIYYSAKRTFATSKVFQSEIKYEFTNGKLLREGEGFSSEIELEKFYKIEELKKWFLIHQSKQSANFIPKANLTSREIDELRYIFKGLSGVKVKVKR